MYPNNAKPTKEQETIPSRYRKMKGMRESFVATNLLATRFGNSGWKGGK